MNDLRTDSVPLPKVSTTDEHGSPKDEDAETKTEEPINIVKDPRVVHLRDCSKIHIGPFYGCPDPASVRTPPPGDKKPVNSFCDEIQLPPESHIRALLKSSRETEPNDFDVLSPHIGHTWRELGRKMSYSVGELDNIDADNQRLLDKAYSLFTLWRDRESDQATVSNLTKLLMTVKVYDAVRKLRP